MNKSLVVCVVGLALSCSSLFAQKTAKQEVTKDIDPLALHMVKAATDPIKNAKAYSFRALVSRDWLGTNDQILTVFSTSEFTVERPNKLHIKFRGRGEPVELFYDGSGKAVLYSASKKFFTTVTAPNTIDAMLEGVAKKGLDIAVRNFLESDPNESLIDDVTTAYVVGKVDLFDQKVYHLAFTEPEAEWQLWIVGDEKPIVKRLEVINKTKPHDPRIIVDFFDWDFNPTTSNDMFTFSKPADAHEIEMLKETAEN